MMNLRKIIATGYCLLLLPVLLIAQSGITGVLRIGDTVPDVTVDITNYGQPRLRLSDLRGKLVILDFWGVYCKVCIENMPKMEELQRKFGDRIQILLVTDDSAEAVARLAEKSQIVRETKLPSIVGDTLFTRLFEYRTVPAHAWIDEDGVVRYFTNGYNTTEKTIRAYLDGKQPTLADKGERRDFDLSKSLLEEGDGRQVKRLQYYSTIMGRIPDYNAGTTGVLIDSITKKPVRIRVLNSDKLYLYSIAFGEDVDHDFNPFVNENRRILDVANPDALRFPAVDENLDAWLDANIFSYESRVPPALSDSLFSIMQREVSTFFGFRATVKTLSRNCLVLKQVGNMELLKVTERKASKFNLGRHDSLYIRNCPSSFLIKGLRKLYGRNERPLIFDVELPPRIDVSIVGDLTDLPTFRRELKRYGLDLVPEKREIDMLVIAD